MLQFGIEFGYHAVVKIYFYFVFLNMLGIRKYIYSPDGPEASGDKTNGRKALAELATCCASYFFAASLLKFTNRLM
jgi:hypothetical protein